MIINVTRMPKGFHWRALLPGGEPVKRNGKPLQGEALYDDAWEASSAGQSAIAQYDPKNSYVVDEIITHYTHYGRKK
jgi:hypothetical protein